MFGLAGKRSTKSTSGSVRRASVTKNQTETKNKRAVKKSPVKKSTVRKNTEKKSVYNEYFDEKDVNKNNITSKEVINTYSDNGQTDTYKSTYRYEYEYTPEGYPKTIKEFRNDTLEGIKEYEY